MKEEDSLQGIWAVWLLTVFLTVSNASATSDVDRTSFYDFGDVHTEYGCPNHDYWANSGWFDSNNFMLYALHHTDTAHSTSTGDHTKARDPNDEDESNDTIDHSEESGCASSVGCSTPRSATCEADAQPAVDWKASFLPSHNAPEGVFYEVFEVPKAMCRALFQEMVNNKCSATAIATNKKEGSNDATPSVPTDGTTQPEGTCNGNPTTEASSNASTIRPKKSASKKNAKSTASSSAEHVGKLFIGQLLKTNDHSFVEWLLEKLTAHQQLDGSISKCSSKVITMHTNRNGRPKGCAWVQSSDAHLLLPFDKRVLIVDSSAMGRPGEEELFVIVVGPSDQEKAWLNSCSKWLLDQCCDTRNRDILPCWPLVIEMPAVVAPGPEQSPSNKEAITPTTIESEPPAKTASSQKSVTWNPAAPAFFSRVAATSANLGRNWRFDPYSSERSKVFV